MPSNIPRIAAGVVAAVALAGVVACGQQATPGAELTPDTSRLPFPAPSDTTTVGSPLPQPGPPGASIDPTTTESVAQPVRTTTRRPAPPVPTRTRTQQPPPPPPPPPPGGGGGSSSSSTPPTTTTEEPTTTQDPPPPAG